MSICKTKPNCIIPSAAFSVPKSLMRQYDDALVKTPEVGDLVLGEVTELGHHLKVENRTARLHTLNIGTQSIFVFGNRYAPDQYEGRVPGNNYKDAELLSQGGIIAKVTTQNQLIGSPTKVNVLGYICDDECNVVNTKNYVTLRAKKASRNQKGASASGQV